MKCSFCGISLTVFEIDCFEEECDRCRNETEQDYYNRIFEMNEDE